MLLIDVASITIRLLFEYNFLPFTLLYIGAPYPISIVIVLYRPDTATKHWRSPYMHHITMLTVFLASSIVLFESFVCVIFFLPIYFIVVSIAFAALWVKEFWNQKNGRSMKLELNR